MPIGTSKGRTGTTVPRGGGIEPSSDHNLISALEMVDRLQRELDAERQTVKALRSASIASQASRTDLESFFAQCVEDVRCVCQGPLSRDRWCLRAGVAASRRGCAVALL